MVAMTDIVVAVGLLLVIEGLIYAAFPDQMKRMIADFLSLPSPTVSKVGLGAMMLGVFIVWLVRG